MSLACFGVSVDADLDQNTPSPPIESPDPVSNPARRSARRFSSAQSSGYLLCTATGISPLCSLQSNGRYSPKSAIQPDAPVSLTMRTMISSIQSLASGFVKSSKPNETPGSLPRRYTPPWTVRTM